ncbi:delta-lactam-biosynthetic de-N-acetylase [Virgibacillus ndiopensis]|uniref:delta-lactam-biosynthetic de-N-acetylase n=1 Tax=Virgibacillus ndiopensis TaxID=2004408 RepID=UPI000C08DA3E|nr:delta-lactam-biosynthetic de-N-acetylase [Virgibacillus ndiopensis]
MRKLPLVVPIITVFFFTFILMGTTASASYGWGYKKNTDHKVPDVGKYRAILEENGAYYADHSGDKVVYLTFDNGYEEGYTDDILDVLKQENVPATFFVTGHYVKSKPDLIERMVDEGHIIGNHSYHHPDMTILTKEEMRKELEELEDAVAAISDQEELKYMRPPKGVFNQQTLKWANDLGYIHIFWSLAFADWNTQNQKGWKYAFDQIMKQMHPGAIVLLHTVSSDNAESLSKLIKELKRQGYSFKSLDELVLKNMLPEAIYGY